MRNSKLRQDLPRGAQYAYGIEKSWGRYNTTKYSLHPKMIVRVLNFGMIKVHWPLTE